MANHQFARRNLVQSLNAEKVRFSTSRERTNLFDRLPIVGAGDAIVSIDFWYDSQLNPETIERLSSIGTVRDLSYVNTIDTGGVELISSILTIESIYVEYHVPAEHVAPFRNHKLLEYSVSGPDVYPKPEAIKILYSIPTLKFLGTAHGEHDVPIELKEARPDITIKVTDFSA